VRWRLAAVIAVPTVIAAVFGAVQIGGDANAVGAFGRDQHLARLNAAVVKLTQNLEDERDLSAAYVARGSAGSVPVTLARARTATDAADRTVRTDAAGVGAGYSPAAVQDLTMLLASLASLADLESARKVTSSGALVAPGVIKLYTDNLIGPANTFSAAVGGGINDAAWQGTVTTLAALLRAENEQSVQRAILYAALSAQPPVLTSASLTSLEQAFQQEQADLDDFGAGAGTAEQQLFSNTVYGPAVNRAAAQEDLAMAHPSVPLTRITGLDAASWYSNMSTTIGDTRQVTDQLAGQLTTRANTLKADPTRSLLLAGIVTSAVLLLLLVMALVRRRSL
jgi:hypothetical protein